MRLSTYIIMLFAVSLSATHAKHAESDHTTIQADDEACQLCTMDFPSVFSYTTASTCQVDYIGHLNFIMYPIY